MEVTPLTEHRRGLVAIVNDDVTRSGFDVEFFAVPGAHRPVLTGSRQDVQRRVRYRVRPFRALLSDEHHLDYFVEELDEQGLDAVRVTHPGVDAQQAVDQGVTAYSYSLAPKVDDEALLERLRAVGLSFPHRSMAGYVRDDHTCFVQEMRRWSQHDDPARQREYAVRLAEISTQPYLGVDAALAGYERLGLDARRLRPYTALSQELSLQENQIDAGIARMFLREEIIDETTREYFPEP